MSSNNGFPWQKTAKNLIRYAQKFQNTNDEFERQVGYLLLDVGVETLFRVFVTQPGIEVKLGYTRRDKIAKGTVEKTNFQRDEITLSGFDELAFHKLTDAVKQMAGEKVNTDDIKRVEYFHNIRNKIYHLGDGIVPTKENFEEYLELAQSLLKTLLNVSQDSEQMVLDVQGDDLLFGYFTPVMERKREYYDFKHDIAVATAIFRPNYATRSFEERLKELGEEVDTLSSIPFNSSSYEVVATELIQRFNKLTGQKLEDTEFILEACFDVTYLQLAVLLSNLREDLSTGLETYKKFRDFSRKDTPNNFNEITQEDIDAVNSFSDWVHATRNKINSWTESRVLKT